jgi:hypothetical protein
MYVCMHTRNEMTCMTCIHACIHGYIHTRERTRASRGQARVPGHGRAIWEKTLIIKKFGPQEKEKTSLSPITSKGPSDFC